jgi:NAD(P)-dependent dehydrogenase (short-subunit alcohol dehydrogenase family)
MPTVLVTGASRGIGLEFVRQYAAQGWSVLASCRDPAAARALQAIGSEQRAVRVHALDVSDVAAIDGLAKSLRGQPIDVLINNAGLYGPRAGVDHDPGQLFGHMDYAKWRQLFAVNAIAPFRMAEAFVEHVAASDQKKIIALTSRMSSIAETSGSFHAYRTTKAALNMAMASLARDLAPRGIRIGLFSPGWVRTDMGGSHAPLSVEESVRGLCQRIAELDDTNSGSFRDFDGKPLPW